MRNIWAIAKRELRSYFGTPIAYVFLAIFVALTGVFAFFIGTFFDRGEADLQPFFEYHPWLYLLLVPAIAMRLWSEERRSGTIELLMTLPVTPGQAVLGKFLAGWVFLAIALILTMPIWYTVNLLGDPDNGVILANYIGSLLMAGAFLAIGATISALTKNQVIAFVVSAAICFMFVLSGTQVVLGVFQGWLPEVLISAITSLSVLNHYENVTRGVFDFRDIVFYVSMIAFWLFANTVTVHLKKAD
jgi:ABC-2 type transport system permease protein